MRRVTLRAVVIVALAALVSCGRRRPQAPEGRPAEPAALSRAQVAALVPRAMSGDERLAWADAILDALGEVGMRPTREPVCEVVAVIDQESSFRENPTVPNLARIVKDGIDQHARKLGPLGPPLVRKLLAARGEGETRTFGERLEAARTERDVDRTFRAMVAHWRGEYPKAMKAANLVSDVVFDKRLSDYNPITTAGSMQVSVRFAVARAGGNDDGDEARVREELYTRAGGVRYGVARLLSYEASYDAALYRFADYNAGLYSARNAAVQDQLATLTGARLARDGDLLLYDADGTPSSKESQSLKAFVAFARQHAPELDERRIRKDLRLEKSLDLESTDSYRALKAAYRAATGRAPAYARLPEVELHSPKLATTRTTEWFARSVAKRCDACLARARAAR